MGVSLQRRGCLDKARKEEQPLTGCLGREHSVRNSKTRKAALCPQDYDPSQSKVTECAAGQEAGEPRRQAGYFPVVPKPLGQQLHLTTGFWKVKRKDKLNVFTQTPRTEIFQV